MIPKGNDIIIDNSISRFGTAFLKVISSREVDKRHYWEQAGSPAEAECVRWSEDTGMHYMTMWWPVTNEGDGD